MKHEARDDASEPYGQATLQGPLFCAQELDGNTNDDRAVHRRWLAPVYLEYLLDVSVRIGAVEDIAVAVRRTGNVWTGVGRAARIGIALIIAHGHPEPESGA